MFMAGNCHSKQKKVKLFFSRPGTAIKNRKRKNNMFMAGTAIQNRKSKISMFVAGNCRSKEKNLRLLAGDTSLPRSRQDRTGVNVPHPALRGSFNCQTSRFPIVLQFSLLGPMNASFRLNTTHSGTSIYQSVKGLGNLFVISRVHYIEHLDLTIFEKTTKMFDISRYS